jgi:hypothetical protein
MWRVRWTGEPFWCRAVRVRSGLVLFNSRIERERESSLLAAPKTTRQSLRVQGRMTFCSLGENLLGPVRALAPDGVHHVVELAFAANIKVDVEVLTQGGSIATYATNALTPEIPFWQLVFMNARIFFIGSDDVPDDAKIDATRAINQALEAGWQGLDIAEIVPLIK